MDDVAAIADRELGAAPDRIGRVDEGRLHETYRVDCDGGEYLLQFASGEDDREDSLRRGLYCYRALEESRVLVPGVVTPDVREYDGRRYVLVDRLPGESAKLDVTPGRVRAAGRHLARIHAARPFETAGWIRVRDGGIAVDAFDEAPTERVRRSLAESADRLRGAGLDAAAVAVAGVADRVGPGFPGPFDPVLCHDDFSPDNVLFRGSEVTGVVDFDRAYAGHAHRDLAAAANGFWMHDPAVDWDLRATFYGGYRDATGPDGFGRTEPVYRVETLARLVSGMLDEFSNYELDFYADALRDAADRVER